MSDELKLPTKEDIAQLPIWAIVAFAARCARRVQPLFTRAWPDAPKEHVQAVDEAITFSEKAAANAKTATKNTYAYASKALHVIDTVPKDAFAKDTAAKTANAAYNAAYAAFVANNAIAVATAAMSATYAAAHATKAAKDAAASICRDFDILKETAEREHWTGNTPVPQKVFGPMWPDGKPKGWLKFDVVEDRTGEKIPLQKAIKAAAKSIAKNIIFFEQPPLEIYIDPGKASKETIQAVFEAISEWHIAAGGLGLEFVSDGNFIYATDKVLS